jgi:hypothetical protein
MAQVITAILEDPQPHRGKRAWRDHAEALADAELGRPVLPVGRPGVIRHQAAIAPGG